jgi:hypothetical protein
MATQILIDTALTRLRLKSLRAGWCIILCSLFAGTTLAAELRPYAPPVQQSLPYEQKRQIQQQPIQDPYYQDFAAKTARLTSEQRQSLINIFTQRLNDASRAKNWDEARHYAKLLEILNTRNAP